MDSISIVMFIVPLLLAIILTMLTLTPKGADKPHTIFTGSMITFFSAMLASVCWFIFGLTWPAVATDAMFVSVAYLWYGIGVIFAVFTIVSAFKMVTAYFDNHKPEQLKLVRDDGAE